MNRVYSTLIQEERVKAIAHAKEERGEIMGLVVQTTFKPKGREQGEGQTSDLFTL